MFGASTRALAFTTLASRCFFDRPEVKSVDDLQGQNCSDTEMPTMENAWTGLVLQNGHYVPEDSVMDVKSL